MPALVIIFACALLAGSSAQTSSMLRLPVSSALYRCLGFCAYDTAFQTSCALTVDTFPALACGNVVVAVTWLIRAPGLSCSGALLE